MGGGSEHRTSHVVNGVLASVPRTDRRNRQPLIRDPAGAARFGNGRW